MFPVVAASPLSKNNLYVVWNDNTTGNYEIYFAKSTDGGNSFSQPVNLAREDVLGIPAMAASEKTNLYITRAANFTGNYVIRFTHSTDGRGIFSAPVSD